MTFLFVSVYMFIISATIGDLLDPAEEGRVIYTTTMTLKTEPFLKGDTSPYKHLMGDVVEVEIICKDTTNNGKLDVDFVTADVKDSLFEAAALLDEVTVSLIISSFAEKGPSVCESVRRAESYYQHQLDNTSEL